MSALEQSAQERLDAPPSPRPDPGPESEAPRSELIAGLPGTIHGSRVVVSLPAFIRQRPGVDVGDRVRAAWAPGVTVVIADMAGVVMWDDAGLRSLLGAYRDLVNRRAELRLVVWSADLYLALRTAGVSPAVPIYANLGAALRPASGLPPGGL